MSNILKSALDTVKKPTAKIVGGLVLTAAILSGCGADDNNDNNLPPPSVVESPDNGGSDVLDIEDNVEYQPVDVVEENGTSVEQPNQDAAVWSERLVGVHQRVDQSSPEGIAAITFASAQLDALANEHSDVRGNLALGEVDFIFTAIANNDEDYFTIRFNVDANGSVYNVRHKQH